jgi:AraC family ethanolamine operon transcriptional activator
MNSIYEPLVPDLPNELREVSVERIVDPTTVGETIEVLNHEVVNLASNLFEVKRITVPLEQCCLIYTWSNSALRTRATVHRDFDLCTILGPQARGNLDGVELNPYALITAGKDVQADVNINNGYEAIACLVPPQLLDKHLAIRGSRREAVIPKSPMVLHPAVNVAREHFELGKQIAIAAEASPEIFNNSQWARYGAQVELLDALLATIESCDREDNVDIGTTGKSYSRIVRVCENYTLNLEGRRPYVSELCEAANVSERTLQNAFNNITGVSPLTYLLRLRLHRTRDELRKANPGSTTVTDVATNWGFWHFGDFSRAYKDCFGEVPSNTLKKNSKD